MLTTTTERTLSLKSQSAEVGPGIVNISKMRGGGYVTLASCAFLVATASCAASGCTQDSEMQRPETQDSGVQDAGAQDVGTATDPDGGPIVDPGPATSGFTRVFHDGFEDGTTDKWQSRRARAHVVTSNPRSGTYAAESNWNGTLDWTDPETIRGISLDSWPYEQEFLVRFWLRIDADVDLDPNGRVGGKLFRLPFSNEAGGNTIIWSDADVHVTIRVNDHPSRSIWSCADLTDRGWHKVEIYVRDATEGAIRMWVDDTEMTCANSSEASLPFLGNTHENDAGWDNFYWPSNWSGAEGCCTHDAENHMYLDDVEIFSDATTGEAIRGSLSDGTAEIQ